jgi:membrane protein implicated in regulation of membrane protease activity
MPGPDRDDDPVEIDSIAVRIWQSADVDAWLLWLIASGLFAAGELASGDLFLLMLAGGAIGGVGVALLGGPVVLQLAAFVVVAALLVAVVRPLAKRHLTEGTPEQPDGVAALVGRTAKVTRPVDGHGGRIRLGADEWTARSQYGGEHFPVGATVRILQVDGATAVVGDALELE